MVRHNVFFWLVPSLTDEQKTSFENGLKALFEIDVVRKGSYGTPAATPERPVTQNDFDYYLCLEFASVEDHNIYQEHPDHEVFVHNFSQWFETVKVFDTEILN